MANLSTVSAYNTVPERKSQISSRKVTTFLKGSAVAQW